MDEILQKYEDISPEQQEKISKFVKYIVNHHDRKKYGRQTRKTIQKAIQTKFSILLDLLDCERLRLQQKKLNRLKKQKQRVKSDPSLDKETKAVILEEWDTKIEKVRSTLKYSKLLQNTTKFREIREHLLRQEEIIEHKKLLYEQLKNLKEKQKNGSFISSGEERAIRLQIELIRTDRDLMQMELQNNASQFQTISFLRQANVIDADGKETNNKAQMELNKADLNCFDIVGDIFANNRTTSIKEAEKIEKEGDK